MNDAKFLWGCRGLAPAVFKTRNGFRPFRSKVAVGGFPENARHFPVVMMPRPGAGRFTSSACTKAFGFYPVRIFFTIFFLSAFAEDHGLPMDECPKISCASARCRPEAEADNRVVAEGEDG